MYVCVYSVCNNATNKAEDGVRSSKHYELVPNRFNISGMENEEIYNQNKMYENNNNHMNYNHCNYDDMGDNNNNNNIYNGNNNDQNNNNMQQQISEHNLTVMQRWFFVCFIFALIFLFAIGICVLCRFGFGIWVWLSAHLCFVKHKSVLTQRCYNTYCQRNMCFDCANTYTHTYTPHTHSN